MATISNMYFAPGELPCELDGVQTNFPVSELIVAPVGGPFSRLYTTSSIELSITPTVNETVFPSSIVTSEIDLNAKTKSGTSKILFPSYSILIVTPLLSF